MHLVYYSPQETLHACIIERLIYGGFLDTTPDKIPFYQYWWNPDRIGLDKMSIKLDIFFIRKERRIGELHIYIYTYISMIVLAW